MTEVTKQQKCVLLLAYSTAKLVKFDFTIRSIL